MTALIMIVVLTIEDSIMENAVCSCTFFGITTKKIIKKILYNAVTFW